MEVAGDVFVLAVEEGVDEVGDRAVVGDVVEAYCCGHDCMWEAVPVAIFNLCRPGMSSAACMSPRKRWVPKVGCV